jgi:hypothetical protein
VVELADHYQNPLRPVALSELPPHFELISQANELVAKVIVLCFARIEFDPHEEGLRRSIVELLRLEDVAAACEKE